MDRNALNRKVSFAELSFKIAVKKDAIKVGFWVQKNALMIVICKFNKINAKMFAKRKEEFYVAIYYKILNAVHRAHVQKV
jgi:hypothetical protein